MQIKTKISGYSGLIAVLGLVSLIAALIIILLLPDIRYAAWGILAGLGLLFFLRVIGVMVNALTSQTPIAETELALHASDFLITPAWVIGGVLLWRRKEFGYVTGLGLLFQASMLFIALIIFFVKPFGG